MSAAPEEIGQFRLYAPHEGDTGWTMSWKDQWLPVVLADRDVCLVLIGMLLEPTDEDTELVLAEMGEMLNRQSPSVDITLDHLVRRLDGGTGS